MSLLNLGSVSDSDLSKEFHRRIAQTNQNQLYTPINPLLNLSSSKTTPDFNEAMRGQQQFQLYSDSFKMNVEAKPIDATRQTIVWFVAVIILIVFVIIAWQGKREEK